MEEDMIEEVLLRLPVESIARCKCLSKKWRRILSKSRTFRRRFIQIKMATGTATSPPEFLGFFCSRGRLPKQYTPVRFVPASTRANQLVRRQHIWASRNTPTFDPALCFVSRPLRISRTIHVMASSNGFLLCSLQQYNPMSYFLCNPVTKRWVALPAPNSTSTLVSHGLFCDPATCYYSFRSVKYKVVRAVWQKPSVRAFSDVLKIEIISSESKNQWKVLSLTCHSTFCFLFKNIPAMVCEEEGESVFYWPAMSRIKPSGILKSVVVFDPRKEFLDKIELPDVEREIGHGGFEIANTDAFCQSEGNILYIRQDYCDLEIWILDKENCTVGPAEWRLKQKNSIGDLLPEYTQIARSPRTTGDLRFNIIGVHPTNSQIIFIAEENTLMKFDAVNSSFSLVCRFIYPWGTGFFFFPYVWPHWPPLFL